MSTSTTGRFGGVPRFGPWVKRERLLRVLTRAAPTGLLLAAPAGFGKTVLAAQYATGNQFDDVVWIPCDGAVLDGASLLRSIAQALGIAEEDRQCAHADRTPETVDWLRAIRDMFRSSSLAQSACVVLDDVRTAGVLDELDTLLRIIERESHCASLVMTTRDRVDECASSFSGFMVLDRAALEMDSEESRMLIEALSGSSADEETVDNVCRHGGGHAALLSVLARHVALGSRVNFDGAPDLAILLRRLVEDQLSEEERELVYGVALLGSLRQHDLHHLGTEYRVEQVRRIADCVPLIQMADSGSNWGTELSAHTLAQQVFGSRHYRATLNPERERRIWLAALGLLSQRCEYGRAIEHLMSAGEPDELLRWLSEHGAQASAVGFRLAVKAGLDALESTRLIDKPRLLLLSAEVEIESGCKGDALVKAAAARDIALNEGDLETYADALLLLSESHVGEGVQAPAIEPLETLLALPDTAVSWDRKAVALSYLLTYSVMTCDWDKVSRLVDQVELILGEGKSHSPEVNARLLAQLGTAHALRGQSTLARNCLQEAQVQQSVSTRLRAMIVGNYATALLEIGCLQHSREKLVEVVEATVDCGLDCYNLSYRESLYAADYVIDGHPALLDEMGLIATGLFEVGDTPSEIMARLRLAMLLRSAGRTADALLEVERAKERPLTQGTEYLRVLADIEFAATLLAMNDLSAASDRILQVVDRLASNAAPQQQFLCDLIMAEIARRQDHLDEADTRLFAHREYVMSGNVNWIAGLYIRAFPDMLGLIARVVDVASIPVHLLKILVSHHAEDALVAACDLIDESEWLLLARRLLGEKDAESRIAALRTAPPCRVRMFGGLDVTIGSRRVDEREWAKRKARLIFASLVIKNGREVPRDQFFEHLWPNMDEDRARNNFYVIWSAMKGVLSPGAGKNVPCPYVDNAGGVCRCVPELVWSDVREFEQTVADARQAEKEGDSERAIRRYERLLELYVGELLPGDMYEDWFSDARDRYRQEFGDAMLAAQRLMGEAGDPAGALRFIRRAIDADPWREDLVQAALRVQISTGQRSAAVETYLTCRSRLVEDLGLDPSGETLRLYEQVLAMEDFAEPDRIQ